METLLSLLIAFLSLTSPLFSDSFDTVALLNDDHSVVPYGTTTYRLYGQTWYVDDVTGLVTRIGYYPLTSTENQQLATIMYLCLSQVNAESISASSDIAYAINFWGERIDINTENLHGDNLNLLNYLTNLFGKSFWYYDASGSFQRDQTFSDFMGSFYNLLRNSLTARGTFSILSGSGGLTSAAPGYSLFNVAANGFLGLSRNLIGTDQYAWGSVLSIGPDGDLIFSSDGTTRVENILEAVALISRTTSAGLWGVSRNLVGDDVLTTFSWLVPSEDGGLEVEDQEVNNILDALGLLGTALQNPLAKLQYVLASDDDIELKNSVQDNQDAFQDSFTGDGEGSLKPDKIGDAGSLSGSMQNSFSDSASAGDVFLVLNDRNSYSFFSQEVADDLDTVGRPAALAVDSDDSWLDAFVEDSDGFFSLKEKSSFDPFAFLGGLGE